MAVALVLHRADGTPVSTTFRRARFGKNDPFARVRDIAWEGSSAMIAGRASFIGEREVASFPHTETLVVLEGELSLTTPGAPPLVVGPEAGAVIARGTAVCIHAASRVRFVFCAATGEATAKPGLSSLCAEADFEPSAHESMHLPAGSVRFAGPHGSVLAVRDGDALFVPQAAPIAWESSGRVAKVYASRGKDQLPNGRSFSIG